MDSADLNPRNARLLSGLGRVLGAGTRLLSWRCFRPLLKRLKPIDPFAVRIATGDLRAWRLITSRRCADTMWIGNYEGRRRDIMRAFVRPGQVVFDVGAHIGFFTLWFSKLVGPDGGVVAFEPCPANLSLLRANVSANLPRTLNVHIEPAAVGHEDGETRLHTPGGVSTMSRIEGLPLAGRTQLSNIVTVASVTLDSFWQRSGRSPSLLKIDVEGAELAVLEGGRRLLSECRPTIFLEAHFGIVDLKPLLPLLGSLNYMAFDFEGREIDDQELANKRVIEYLLVLPAESRSRVI